MPSLVGLEWPGTARTILLFHIISARPSKLPLMVRTLLKVYGARLLFLFLQEQIKDTIIIISGSCRTVRASGGVTLLEELVLAFSMRTHGRLVADSAAAGGGRGGQRAMEGGEAGGEDGD